MPIEQTALRIDCATGRWQAEEIIDPDVLGPVDYGLREYLKDRSVFIFGGGVLAGSRIPGARRMVFVAHSPAWDGFYVSTLGGAAYVFHRLGVDYVTLQGACPVDSVLILNNKGGQISARFEPCKPDEIWPGHEGETGFYALQKYLFDKYKGEYSGDWVRVLALGPGGLDELSPLPEPTEWQAWNDKRDRAVLAGRGSDRYLPDELRVYSDDFDRNGRWIDVRGYGNCWIPTVVVSGDWAPYRHGRWCWRGN